MIPRRIIQTDKSVDLPLLQKAAVSSVRLNNPDYEYVFFDDQQVEDFVDEHFPHYRATFDAFPVPIQRYDFFRYLAVFKFGGFYFDTDIVLARGLDDLLGHACVFPFERLTWSDHLRSGHGMDWEIGNYAFGAEAGHPFLAAVIENCVRALDDRDWAGMATASLPSVLRDELYVIYTTGPGLVTRTLAERSPATGDVEVLFPDDVCDKGRCWNLFGDYGVHLGGGSWRKLHGPIRRRLLNYHAARNEHAAVERAREVGPSRALQVTRAKAA